MIFSVVTHADIASSYSEGAQANTSGNFSIWKSSHKSVLVGAVSSIEVFGHTDFSAETTYLEGSSLLFGGTGHVSLGSVIARTVDESSTGSSFGLCSNAYDLMGGDPSRSWGQAIPTLGIQKGAQDYRAGVQATVWSADGRGLSFGSMSGDPLHTASRDGRRVTRDDHYNLEVKVPLYNPQGLSQLRDNLTWLDKKLHPQEETPSSSAHVLPARAIKAKHTTTAHSSDETKEAHHVSSKPVAKHKSEAIAADDDFLDEAEDTLAIVGQGLHRPIGITGDSVRFFRGSSSMSRRSEWGSDHSSTKRWQHHDEDKSTEVKSTRQSSQHHSSVAITHTLMGTMIKKYVSDTADEVKQDIRAIFIGDKEAKIQAAKDLGGKALTVGLMFATRGESLAATSEARFLKAGDKMLFNTGGRLIDSVSTWNRGEKEAEVFYEKIRSSKSNADVIAISKNTGIPEYRIQRIKDHVFSKEHILEGGKIARFDPDIEIADAWYRLQKGNYVQQDINLLNHEYFESRFENIFRTNYTTAHKAAEKSFRIWNPHEFVTEPDMRWRP